MSRDICKMHPDLLAKYKIFDDKMIAVGIKYIITSVDRLLSHQMALYVQGRLPIEGINKFRIAAGLTRIPTIDVANKKVTWTLNSKHIIIPGSVNIDDRFSRAFDIALLKGQSAHWDVKVSVNDNEVPDYLEVAEIAEQCGLMSGALWKDYTHIQLP